jgi:hypothetical protein
MNGMPQSRKSDQSPNLLCNETFKAGSRSLRRFVCPSNVTLAKLRRKMRAFHEKEAIAQAKLFLSIEGSMQAASVFAAAQTSRQSARAITQPAHLRSLQLLDSRLPLRQGLSQLRDLRAQRLDLAHQQVRLHAGRQEALLGARAARQRTGAQKRLQRRVILLGVALGTRRGLKERGKGRLGSVCSGLTVCERPALEDI